MRKIVSKTSFLGGEAGPMLEGRSDLAQHQLGCSRLENFIALKAGGATRRPGTRYVKGTQGNLAARLIPFVTSYDDGSSIYVVEITKNASTQLTFRVIRVSDNTVYTPSGSPVVDGTFYKVASTVSLDEIQYIQSADHLFLVADGLNPLLLRRLTATTFDVSLFIDEHFRQVASGAWAGTPFRDANVTSMTMAPSVTTGTGNLVSSAAFFDSGHVGTYMRLTHGATIGYAQITGFTNNTTVTISVKQDFGATTATTDWAEGAWSAYRGFPKTVAFYNQRSVFGGNTSQPDTFWASQSSDYYQMHDDPATPGVADPQIFTLASQRLNEIRWMVGGKKLTIGTSSSEWVGQFVEDGTSLRVDFDEETTHGSSYVQPNRSAYTIPFVQRSRKMIREMVFDFNSDSYVATDLNLFSNHIGTPYGRFVNSSNVYILQVALQESPFNILWVIDSVGRLYGLTRDRQQQVATWHSHVIGGRLTEAIFSGGSGDDYAAFVTSICVVPDSNGQLDRLWMVVRRAINGVDTYFVEYMDDIKAQPNLLIGSATNIKSHIDCATAQSGASATVWTGYTRFAGEEVYVIAEKAGGVNVYAGLLTVNGSGEITLPVAATLVCVGLHADAELRPLPIEGGDAPEIKMRSIKKIDSLAMRLHQTWGLRIGRDRTMRITGNEENTEFEQIPFDTASLPYMSTFTGVKEVTVPGDSDVDASYTLAMQEPWPCTILSLAPRVVSNEV